MIDDRQFFISSKPSVKYPDWNSISLSDDYYIYYQKDLNIIQVKDNYLILGIAWQVDSSRLSPREELVQLSKKSNITQSDIFEMEKTWCGRYILIVKDYIYLDAGGCLGVFYSDKTISSSLHVLCNVEERKIVSSGLKHRTMPDFFIGMRTPYEGVRRLLPSQILNYKNTKTQIRPLLIDFFPEYTSLEEGSKKFIDNFVYSLQNMEKTLPDHKKCLALTGGRDSRCVMSLLEKSGIDYDTFTLWHENISEADKKIPKRLSKLLHRKYKFVERSQKKYSQQRLDEFFIHTAEMSVDEDSRFFAYNQYQSIAEGRPTVILRSSIWEIVDDCFKMDIGSKKGDRMCILFPRILENKLWYASAKEWENYIKEDKLNSDISFYGRAYWDLRIGCWLSSLEQSLDMIENIITIQSVNSRLFISMLFAFPYKERFYKYHENIITNNACSILKKIPYDYQYECKRLSFNNCLNTIKSYIWKIIH